MPDRGTYWLGASDSGAVPGGLMFPEAPGAVRILPSTPGVYRFRDLRGRL